jgi:formylglycine-generating enzyme required for sulfatase activity
MRRFAAALTAVTALTAIMALASSLRPVRADPPRALASPVELRVGPRPIVWIPDGRFVRGSGVSDLRYALTLCVITSDVLAVESLCRDEIFLEETPARMITLRGYGIDRTEVTQAAYRGCVEASRCPPPRVSASDARIGGAEHPVAGVTFHEAALYCDFVGGRLPTEAEWERAARGDGAAHRRFPWGRPYNARLANHGKGGERPDGIDGFRYAAPVGSFPDGRSPFGLDDMAGNVWEWTADRFVAGGYAEGPTVDPRGGDASGERVVRGGSWRSSPITLRVTHRVPVPETLTAPDLGFRCAYDRAL